MKAIHRAALAAIQAAAIAAVPFAAAAAQTDAVGPGFAADIDDMPGLPVPQQDLTQLALVRQRLFLALQALAQDQSAGNADALLADEQSVFEARRALISAQISLDQAREAQGPDDLQAALQLRDLYLSAQLQVVAAQLTLVADIEGGNAAAAQADEMGLRQVRLQAMQARLQWTAVRSTLVASGWSGVLQSNNLQPGANVPILTPPSATSPSASPPSASAPSAPQSSASPPVMRIVPPPPPSAAQPPLAPAPTTR